MKKIGLLVIALLSLLLVAYTVEEHPNNGANVLAPQRTPTQPGATQAPTTTRTPTLTPSATQTVSYTPTGGVSATVTNTVTVTAEVGTPTITPTPTVTTVFQELRTLQEDGDFLLRFELDAACYEVETEITGILTVFNFSDDPIYLYLAGQIMFSINNSLLLPDFPPREPATREDFIIVEPNEEATLLEIEDLGLYIQGMGSESGIDFFETETIYGLPVGVYWVIAGYSNPHNGLKQQIDRTYLIPEAAWRGVAISREERFVVVENLDDCPNE